MLTQPNYLLGKGENLADSVQRKAGSPPGPPPYSFGEAKRNLTPNVQATAKSISALPRAACPNDEAVAVVTLHPQYISKSSYPAGFLAAAGLRAVGSRPVTVQPKKWTKKADPDESPTSELFVAGQRDAFIRLAQSFVQWTEQISGAEEIVRIEEMHATVPSERIKPIYSDAEELLLEVVLHAGEKPVSRYVINGFKEYLETYRCWCRFEAKN